MPLRLGPLTLPWPRHSTRHDDDPFWEHFVTAPAADLANSVVELMRRAPDGNVFPTKAELHTPEVTSSHVKEMARYLGADLVGVAALEPPDAEGYPFAVVCAVRADRDPRTAPGIGGQVPVQNGLFVTFVLSAWIRELGFRATATASATATSSMTAAPSPTAGSGMDAERLAAAAGLGTLDRNGRLVTREYGSRVHVADVIRTDLPLAADR